MELTGKGGKMGIEWTDRMDVQWKNANDAIEFLHIVDWNLSIIKVDTNWYLYAGDQPICSSETIDELNSFVMGMALSYSVLPDAIIKEIQNLIAKDSD